MLASCIKCRKQYDEKSDEAYLCEDCLLLKKSIAEEIDRKFPPGRVERRPSELDIIKSRPRIGGLHYINL